MTRKQQGFTIIELMIATSIFSLVLMICMTGILQITKMYYKGTTQAKTQDVARGIIDDIGESIRFSSDSLRIGRVVKGPDIDLGETDTGFFCLGAKRYTYVIDRKLTTGDFDAGEKKSKHVLWVDQPDAGCNSADIASVPNMSLDRPSSNGRELLPENMRLSKFEVSKSSTARELYRIAISVAYGEDDLLRVHRDLITTKTCEGAFIGAEFCAVSTLSITVGRRL